MRTIAALLFLLPPLALAQDAPVSARERAKRQLVVRAAAQRVVDALQDQAEPDGDETMQLVAELGERMQHDVQSHADPAASRTLCAGILADQRRRTIGRWVDEALSRAREQTALPVGREDVLHHVGADWNTRVGTEAAGFADKHIEEVFTKARKQSVALQRDEIQNRVQMPAEAELDERLNKLAESAGHHPPTVTDLDSLTDWVASFAAADDRPLFNEVQHTTREASGQIVRRIKDQYQGQLAALKKAAAALPPAALDADRIHSVLLDATLAMTKAVRAEETRNRPDSPLVVYGPLAVIRAEAERMASVLEEDRIAEAIQAQADLPIDAASVESALRSNLKAHVALNDSRNLLLAHYAAELQPWLVTRLAERAERGDEAAFLEYMAQRIVQSKRLTKTVNDHVVSTLDRVLAGVRRKVAGDQLLTVFGVDPATIEVLASEAIHALWAADRCDPAATFEQAWQSIDVAGLRADAAGEGGLIEETRGQITATANRLIPPAGSAMREQGNRLSVLEKEWTGRLRKDVESGRSLEKITADWTGELERRWREYAEKEAIPYTDLFARTLDLLNKTVRKLFESRKTEMEAAAKAAEEKPAEPVPEKEPVKEPPPPEETPEPSKAVTIEDLLETLDFVLYFRDAGDGRSEALLLDGEGASTQRIFDPGNVQEAVEAVYRAISPALEAAIRGKATANPKRAGILSLFQKDRTLDLKIAVLVGSEDVRHMMSILVRHRVELFVADWNANPANPTLELEWEDDLELAQ